LNVYVGKKPSFQCLCFNSEMGIFFCLFQKVHSVAWNCIGTKLASGSVDQTARIWHIDPHAHVVTLLLIAI